MVLSGEQLASLDDVGPARRAPRTWRPRDPWVAVVGLVALATYLLHGFQGLFSRDLGAYAYGARQVLAGEPPYVGIVNRAGPLAHLLPVPGILAARAVGGDEVVGMRAWYLVFAVACVMVTYVVARGLFASRAAGLAAAATLLSFEGFLTLAVGGPREKTPMVLFILCAIWAMSHRRWLLTGVSISLATLTLQTALLPLLAGAVLAVVLTPSGERVRDLARLAIGGALPVAVLLPYFAAYGAVRDFLDGFLLLNLRYSHGVPISARPVTVWHALQVGYGASLWLLLAGLVLVVVVPLVRYLDPSTRHEPATVTLVAVALVTVGSLLWTEVDYDSWEDMFTVLPLAALGIGAGTAWLLDRLPRQAARVVAVAVVVLPTALAVHFSVTARDHTLVEQRAVVDVLMADVPHARIWSIESPQSLVLARTVNPTRFQLLAQGLRRDVADRWAGGMPGFVAWNLAQHPDLVAVNGAELRVGHWRSRIEPDYVPVAHSRGSYWFARRSLGPQVIDALRRDVAQVR